MFVLMRFLFCAKISDIKLKNLLTKRQVADGTLKYRNQDLCALLHYR